MRLKRALRVRDMRPSIYQVELIGSGSLSVMAKPVSGEWIDDEFAAIAESGIARIVSLLERSESYEVGLENEKTMLKSTEWSVFHSL